MTKQGAATRYAKVKPAVAAKIAPASTRRATIEPPAATKPLQPSQTPYQRLQQLLAGIPASVARSSRSIGSVEGKGY
jgi:hypothetical protein